jgi:hypothetical protein
MKRLLKSSKALAAVTYTIEVQKNGAVVITLPGGAFTNVPPHVEPTGHLHDLNRMIQAERRKRLERENL